jgi:tetratricopeptide (TPR) repeat protein
LLPIQINRSWFMRAAAAAPLPTLLLLFVAGRCLVPMDETDLFFNLRLGEIVLETKEIPRTNLLSFTHPEARDVNLAWVFQVVLALVHRAGGVPGTVLLKTGFVLGTWALLFRVARGRGAHPAAAAGALALAAWAAEPRFVERPHLVTFLGLAFLLLALERAEAGRLRMLAALVPAGLLWANANSCYFLAPVMLLLYAAGAGLERRPAQARRALGLAALLAPLAFATPSGTGCLPYIANHFRMPTLRPLQEYRSAEWPLDGPFFFLAAGLLGAAIAPLLIPALRARRTEPLLPLRHGLPLLALGVLGALRIRFVAEFAIFAGPALAVAATRLAAAAPSGRLISRARYFPSAAAGLLLLLLAVVPRTSGASAALSWINLGLEPGLVPFPAIAFVERHGLDERLYNDLEVGSYLTWRWWPRRRVFQDPRINGYPEAFHALLRRTDLDRRQWQSFLDAHGVTAALVTYPALNPRAALFDPELWALVYRASDGLVFIRRRPNWRSFATEHELPITFSYHPARGVEPLVLPEPPEGTAVSPCRWYRRVGDVALERRDLSAARDSFSRALEDQGCLTAEELSTTRRALGAAALQLGDPAVALLALEGIDDPEARTNRAFALLALGQSELALAGFEAVLAAPGGDRGGEALFGRGLALEALGQRAEAAQALGAFIARFPQHPAAAAARARLGRRTEATTGILGDTGR